MPKNAGHHAKEGSDTPEKSAHKPLERQSASRLEKSADFGVKNEARESSHKRAEITENLVRGDMPDTARRRLDNTRDFNFNTDKEFNRELKRREPSTTEGEAKRTLGFHDPRDNQAHVRDGGNTLETALHEKYHQKSDSHLSTRLNEGVTEYMAREKAGGIGQLRDIDNRGRDITPPKAYEKEVDAVRKMSATVGDKGIRSAYFEGKSDELRKSFDSAQGDGAFERLRNAVEKEDKQSVDKIFHNRK